jgi:hypothetical protein
VIGALEEALRDLDEVPVAAGMDEQEVEPVVGGVPGVDVLLLEVEGLITKYDQSTSMHRGIKKEDKK